MSTEKRPETSSLRQKALSHLTTASHIPTAFLGGFMVVHMSAPLMANLGGSVLSTKVMVRITTCLFDAQH